MKLAYIASSASSFPDTPSRYAGIMVSCLRLYAKSRLGLGGQFLQRVKEKKGVIQEAGLHGCFLLLESSLPLPPWRQERKLN